MIGTLLTIHINLVLIPSMGNNYGTEHDILISPSELSMGNTTTMEGLFDARLLINKLNDPSLREPDIHLSF
jgi:hypothetical protein